MVTEGLYWPLGPQGFGLLTAGMVGFMEALSSERSDHSHLQ